MNIELPVTKIHPGCRTAEPVVKDEEVLFPTDYELDNRDILFLKRWRIEKVTIKESSIVHERIPA